MTTNDILLLALLGVELFALGILTGFTVGAARAHRQFADAIAPKDDASLATHEAA